jgi:hypothetical protein
VAALFLPAHTLRKPLVTSFYRFRLIGPCLRTSAVEGPVEGEADDDQKPDDESPAEEQSRRIRLGATSDQVDDQAYRDTGRLGPEDRQERSRKMRVLADVTSGGFIGLWTVIYVVLLITLGLLSIRKGHWVMFLIGFFLPIFWLIGALLPRRR